MRYFNRDEALLDAPYGFLAGDGNIRRYVGNNATNGVDPSGLEEKREWKQGGKEKFWKTGAGEKFASTMDKAVSRIKKLVPILMKVASEEQQKRLKFITDNMDFTIHPTAGIGFAGLQGSQATPNLTKYAESKQTNKEISVDLFTMVNVVIVKGWGQKYEIDQDFDETKHFGNIVFPYKPRLQGDSNPSYAGYDDEAVKILSERYEIRDKWMSVCKDNYRTTKANFDEKQKAEDKRKVVGVDMIDFVPWDEEQVAALIVNELLHFFDVKDLNNDGVYADENIWYAPNDDGSSKKLFDFKMSIKRDNTLADLNSRVAFMHAFYFGEFPKQKQK